MKSEKDTLPNLRAVIDAVNNSQRGMSTKADEVRREINEMRQEVRNRFDTFEQRLEQMRLEMMGFDVRIDRIEAVGHKSLNIGYNVRADVKVLREKVSAWTKEVVKLQNAST